MSGRPLPPELTRESPVVGVGCVRVGHIAGGVPNRCAQFLGRPAGPLGKAQAWVQFGGSKRVARAISRSGPDQARPPGGLSRLRDVVAPFENGVPPRYALSWTCGRVQ